MTRGALMAIASALLFGATTPVAKRLLDGAGPLALAGLLYAGAGLGLTLLRLIAPRASRAGEEARLGWADAGPLAGVIALGGILGPVLLLVGLDRLSGLAGSLLLNLETPLTMTLAVLLFGEHLGRRELAAGTLVLGGALLLGAAPSLSSTGEAAWSRPGELARGAWGAVAVAGACLCWAVDNNLTARLSLRDPIAITRVKTTVAGATSLLAALVTAPAGSALPRASLLAAALIAGSLGYGASIVLAIYAQRALGAARQAVYFATAPFAGALLALPILGERPSLLDGAAGALMLAGAWLLLGARHGHPHRHEALEHEHAHLHDEHHQHEHHGASLPLGAAPHSHPHRHEPLVHEHPHVSDAHHRHAH